MKTTSKLNILAAALGGALAFTTTSVNAADLTCIVQGANQPITGSIVTLYAAGTGVPTQLAQGMTDDNGVFNLDTGTTSADSVLYPRNRS
jgi:hypothetical protein